MIAPSTNLKDRRAQLVGRRLGPASWRLQPPERLSQANYPRSPAHPLLLPSYRGRHLSSVRLYFLEPGSRYCPMPDR